MDDELRAMDEREWFTALYQRYADMLARVGRRLLYPNASEEDVAELVQDVFLLLWNKREALRAHPNPGGWLIQALKFRASHRRDAVTRERLRAAYSLDAEDAAPVCAEGETPEERAAMAVHAEAIKALLGEEDGELFLAYALEGKSARQIAKEMGVGANCVSMRIYRLRRKLREHPEIFFAILFFCVTFWRDARIV